MDRDDPALPREEPQYPRVQLADVTEFKEPVALRFGQRWPVILPVSQSGQTGEHRRKIVGITGPQFVEEFSHRAHPGFRLVEFYGEVHSVTTSFLMFPVEIAKVIVVPTIWSL